MRHASRVVCLSVLALAALAAVAVMTPQSTLASGPRFGATYVALGDSYSAGEGLGPFQTGTDTSKGANANTCHRSKSGAYADLDPAIVLPSVRSRAFWACSGATVFDIENLPGQSDSTAQYGQPDQAATVGWSTKYITLTVGGDDLDFGAIGRACAEAQIHNKVWHFSKTSCSAQITASVKKIPTLTTQLEGLYAELLGESALGSELVVAGYLKILPNSYEALGKVDGIAFCTFDHLDGVGSVGMPVPDAELVASFELKLNDAIVTAVNTTAATYPGRIRYADLYPTSVPRNCQGTTANATVAGVEITPLGNGIGPGGFISTATFHPTKAGQVVYAQAVEAAFKAFARSQQGSVPAPSAGGSMTELCTTDDGLPCEESAVEPGVIMLGADGRTQVIDLKWMNWGRSPASATGRYRSNVAAASEPPSYITARAGLTATGMERCGGGSVYTQLTVKAAGQPAFTSTFSYHCQ